ncbi:MAG: hypothetical protein DDT42_00448 [candidate division WS2 bacterium]|uniref:Capsid protein n=1 Tax=Psychracetigena formicireducens TaxID=2986056 RepID=A0A9E2BHB4_PSYF1|nr:hypothetical protein [Candidatus Psychracetigena formicireducens]
MPTIRDLTPVDPLLTNISLAFRNAGFVASSIFPTVSVDVVSGTYFIYGNERFDVPSALRADKASFNRIDWTISTGTFRCREYGLEDVIDDRERKVAKAPLDLDIDATEFVTDMVALNAEKRVVDIVTDVARITQNVTLAGTSQFNDFTNSDPISVIDRGRNIINSATGLDPNTLVLSREVFNQLKNHPQLLERIKYTQKGVVTADLMAGIFDVENVVVAHALHNSARKGAPVTLVRLWGRHCLLAYVEKNPGIRKVSLGFTFSFTKRRTRKYRHERNIGDVIRVSEDRDEALVAASCGYLIRNAVA